MDAPILWNVRNETTGVMEAVLYLPESTREQLGQAPLYGTIDAVGPVRLAGEQVNNYGQLSADAVQVNVTEAFNNEGNITAGTLLAEGSPASTIDLSKGKITATNARFDFAGWDIEVDRNLSLDNLLVSDNLEIAANTFTNAGDFAAQGNLLLDMRNTVRNTGTISANGLANIRGSQIINERPVEQVERTATDSETVTYREYEGEGDWGDYKTREVTHSYTQTTTEAGEGGVIIGQNVNLEATRGSVINRGGNIFATDDLVVTAAKDIINTSINTTRIITRERDGCEGKACGGLATEFQSAGMNAGGSIGLQSGGDIINRGSQIAGLKDVVLSAAGEIRNESQYSAYRTTDIKKRGFFSSKRKIRYGVSLSQAEIMSGEGDLKMAADSLTSIGGRMIAAGTIQGNIQGDINLLSAAQEVENVDKKRGFSGFSYGSNKTKGNAVYETRTQLLAGDINLQSQTGDLNSEGALLAAANDTRLAALDGNINLGASQYDRYSTSKGWSVGVSVSGAGPLGDVANSMMKGNSLSDAFAQSSQTYSALQTLSGSSTGQTRQNLINASLQVRSSGSALIDAAGGKGNLGDTLNEQFNPFNQKNLDKASGGKDGVGIKVSFGSYKNSDKWTQSTHSEVLAGGNLTLVTKNKGDINVSDGTVLTNKGDPFASLDESFVNSFAEDSALRNMFTAGDQHNDGAITLNAAGTLNIAALQDTHSSESSSFGASVTFTGGAITGAGINASESSSNSTTYTNARITSEGALNLISGGDTNITGGVLSGDTVNYDIGGDLNITSVQDHEDSENSGFELDVSTTGISGSFNSGDSDRDVVNEQSGITAQNGTSGSIGGDVNLEGSYLVDESGTGTLTVDGTVNSTDIDNTANVSSTSISGGMNFGGPTDTPKDPAKGPSKPASSLNLPSHKENDTSSTTHSVLAGITVTDGQGNTITTDHIRDTLDGANETLKDPAEEDLNALEIFAGTLVAVELNNQIGNLAMFNDTRPGQSEQGWQEGGVNKVVTHFLNGSLTHLLTGGDSSDALSAGFGAAAVEATMAHLNTGDAANDQLVASLIGCAVSSLTGGSFDDGAISGAFAESFNRQMHQTEYDLAREMAKDEATREALSKKEGREITEEELLGRIVRQMLRNMDFEAFITDGQIEDQLLYPRQMKIRKI